MRRHLTVTNPSWGKAAQPPWGQWGPHHMAMSPSCVRVPHHVFHFHAHVPIMCLCTSCVSPSCVPVMSVLPSHVHVSTAHLQPHHIPVSPPHPLCVPVSPPHTPVLIPSLRSHYVPIPITHLYPCCMSVPVAHTSPPHDHVPSHIHVLAACPCPHPMSVCPPYARGPIACSCPCCTPMSLLHTTCPRCIPVSLLHTHVPITCPCPHDTPVSPSHARVPVAHPRPHHTPVSPWHLRVPMALSCPHRPHVPMAPPPRCTPLTPRSPETLPRGGSGGPGGSLPGMGVCHTHTRTNLGPDTHVPLGSGRRPGRGDREPLNPPAPGLRLLLLLPFLHPPPAASKGRGGGRGEEKATNWAYWCPLPGYTGRTGRTGVHQAWL